jgi:hypothetical protein
LERTLQFYGDELYDYDGKFLIKKEVFMKKLIIIMSCIVAVITAIGVVYFVNRQSINALVDTEVIQGEKGEAGQDGIDGLNGQNGIDGLSAYEIAVLNGFVGTEEEWLASLHGQAGNNGQNGTNAVAVYKTLQFENIAGDITTIAGYVIGYDDNFTHGRGVIQLTKTTSASGELFRVVNLNIPSSNLINTGNYFLPWQGVRMNTTGGVWYGGFSPANIMINLDGDYEYSNGIVFRTMNSFPYNSAENYQITFDF